MLIISLSLITATSELLGVLKGVECNGIVDYIIRVMTMPRCADVKLPNVTPRHSTDLAINIRRSLDTANPTRP